MSALAAVPAVVAVLGAVLVVLKASRVASEASDLYREIERLGHLRPALVEVRDAGCELRATLSRLRR